MKPQPNPPRSIVVCAVCGGPLYYDYSGHGIIPYHFVAEEELPDDAKPISTSEMFWLADISVMGRWDFDGEPPPYLQQAMEESLSQPQEDLQIVSAEWNSWDIITIHSPPAGVQIWCMLADLPNGNIAFPVHNNCLEIMRVVGKAREEKSQQEPWSLTQFYDAICERHRHDVARRKREYLPRRDYGEYTIHWEHMSYGAGWQRVLWQGMPGTEWMCCDPIEVPNLTFFILSHLESATSRNASIAGTGIEEMETCTNEISPLTSTATLLSLPREIIQQITSYIPCTSTLALHRTCKSLRRYNLTDQLFWRDSLFSGSLVGFLWDLDPSLCQQKTPVECFDRRSLAQRLLIWTSFDTGGEFDNAPMALRNRQRIWRIVVDIGLRDKGDYDFDTLPKEIPKAYLLPGHDQTEAHYRWERSRDME